MSPTCVGVLEVLGADPERSAGRTLVDHADAFRHASGGVVFGRHLGTDTTQRSDVEQPSGDPSSAIARSRELGAGWVPAMLDRLDWTVRSWKKVDRSLAQLEWTPSETLRAQLAFTPFVFEDVGAFIDASADDLYLFSSDYPHVEGGKDSIGRFEQSLGERPPVARDRFYAENFLKIFPRARVH